MPKNSVRSKGRRRRREGRNGNRSSHISGHQPGRQVNLRSDGTSITVRYSVRVTVAAVGTSFYYTVKPSLSNFSQSVNGFQNFYMYYRFQSLGVRLIPTMNSSSVSGTTLYQVPVIALIPALNGDAPTTMNQFLAYPRVATGEFNKPYAMQCKPMVEIANSTWAVCPKIKTSDQTVVQNGFAFTIQRGGTGLAFDFIT